MGLGNPARCGRLLLSGLILVAALPSKALAHSGLLIEDVAAGSAAERAGLRVGDRVVSYEGKSVTSPAVLQALEENTFGKSEVVLRALRGNETLTLPAARGRLGIQTRPELAAAALTLYEEGRQALAARNTSEATAKYSAAAKAAQQAGDLAGAAWLHGRAGELYETQRQWKEARELHSLAWDLLKPSGDKAAQTRRLFALGRTSQFMNDFVVAMQWYEQSLQIDTAEGFEMWAAFNLNNLGAAARSRGDLAAAESFHRRALGIRERLLPDSLDVAASLNNVGIVVYGKGDLEGALHYFTRVLDIRQRVDPESLETAAILNNIGAVAHARGDLDGSMAYHRRALLIREKLAPDSAAMATSLGNMGVLAWNRGDLQAAEDLYQRAHAIFQKLSPDSLDVAFNLNAQGLVAADRGELQVAQRHYERSLAIRQKLAPDSLDVSVSLSNLGVLARDRGDLDAALAYAERALAIRERIAPDSLEVATSLNNLGDLAQLRKDLEKAADYYQRALAIRERAAPDSLYLAGTLANLGVLAFDRGDLTGAEGFQRRALEIRQRLAPDSLDVAETLTDLGSVAAALRETNRARDYHTRALGIRDRLAPESIPAVADLNGLGAMALAEGRGSEALRLYTRAVDIIEAQRWQVPSTESRALLLAQHAESYTGLLRTQIAMNDLPGAFATAERARARSLLEILAEARAEIRHGVDPVLLASERQLQQQLNAKAGRHTQLLSGKHNEAQAAAIKKEVADLLLQYRDVQARIRRDSPRYAALTQPQPLGLAEIQAALLEANTLLLEYVLDEEASTLFAVTAESIESFDLPKRIDIENAARRVYELTVARQAVRGESPSQRRARIAKADADYAAAAATLGRMVLGPVAARLGNRRLLIVADGALQYVPFGALPSPAGRPGAPLVTRHEIVSLPSASVVVALRRELQGRPPAERLVAVIADPVFDAADARLGRTAPPSPVTPGASTVATGLPRAADVAGLTDDRGVISRLPFTRDEADAILAAAPAGQSTRAIDFQASRATATSADLARYRIVHLATHGLLDTEHPELSGIVLSLVDENGTPQDGYLRLHELYNLNWTADLVVLSACQTALGKEIKGEGLLGLTRGFMYGGARRVVASLWNVNDSATAQFMTYFYQGMFGQKLSAAAALRAAQIEMARGKTYQSPYYWAAFVLQGDWK
jgi:CHAT domain-containing protein/Tfp pilus assembly protein PilF